MDITKYPEFLPFCHKVSIVSQQENGIMIADNTLKLAFMTTSYRCEITVVQGESAQIANASELSAIFVLDDQNGSDAKVDNVIGQNAKEWLNNINYPIDFIEINIKSIYSDIFHPLNSRWRLLSLGSETTLVNFMLEFQLHSSVFQHIAELLFPKLGKQTMQAFRDRALQQP